VANSVIAAIKICLDKTRTMILSRESKKKHNVKLENATLEQAETFKYLGTVISLDGRLTRK
jgi:hypothetical protein